MSALVEKLRLPHSRSAVLRILAVLFTAVLLIYYCAHPGMYAGENHASLLESRRTYVAAGFSFLLIVLWLVPNDLSEAMNRRLSWAWFAAAPFAVYFSLLYLNAEKFNIDFFELNKIALGFTFLFLYLVQGLLFGLTGSIRFSVMIYAVAVAVLGIANCFVISFRGMGLSAADLFSIGTAATVASQYTYTLDWYMFMELMCTFAICTICLKLRGGRMLAPAFRAALLGLVAVLAGAYYHICCRTDFLEEHDIRAQGFTHQLRYKQYDMLFTTLCTCFYLSVEKPDGYSLEKVQEIAKPYVTEHAQAEASAAPDSGAATSGVSSDFDAASSGVSSDSGAATSGVSSGSGAATSGVSSDSDAASSGVSSDSGAAASGVSSGSGEDSSGDSSDSGAGQGDAETSVSSSAASSETPHVIVIMNESFADYTDIGRGLALSEDCMPFIHSLTENTIKGTAYSSVFGGNTPNSEYEFLTGNTMGFLPTSSVGFHLFVRGEMPSLASQLGSLGYNTLAMHPYRGTNYRRHIVYPQIGFDTYYSRDDFSNPEYIRRYISDESLFKRIRYEYQQNLETGEPLFSYNVTIQNHGGYATSNVLNVGEDVKLLNDSMNVARTEIYLNLIKETDTAFEKLIRYFEEQEEPVVVIMFGDHQANLDDSVYEYLIGPEEELTSEERMEKYKVPFIVWANYDIEEEVIEKTSLNYLFSIIADRLGLPMTGYQEFLLELSEEVPVLNAIGYWGDDGEFYELDDETSPYSERINEYRILQYNYIFGGEDRYLEFLTL